MLGVECLPITADCRGSFFDVLVRCLSVVPTAAFEAEEAVEVAESGLEVLEAFTVPGLDTVERDFRFEAELRPDVAVVEGRKLIFDNENFQEQ